MSDPLTKEEAMGLQLDEHAFIEINPRTFPPTCVFGYLEKKTKQSMSFDTIPGKLCLSMGSYGRCWRLRWYAPTMEELQEGWPINKWKGSYSQQGGGADG